MSKAPHNPIAPPADTTAASIPAPTPPPASNDDFDLANMVDDLLAQIDDAGQTLANDVAAEVASHEAAPSPAAPFDAPAPAIDAVAAAPAVANPTDATPPSEAIPAIAAVADHPAPISPHAATTLAESPTPEPPASEPISHEDLLAQVDSLIQQVRSTPAATIEAAAATAPPPPPAAVAHTSETPAADTSPALTAMPTQANQPAPDAPAATAPASLAAIDEEVSKIAGKMLDQTPADIELPAPAASSADNSQRHQARMGAPSQSESAIDAPVESPAKKPRLTIRVPSLTPIIAKALAPLSAPLAGKPPVIRQSVGWIACGTIFFSAVLWAVVLTRTPETITHEPGAFDFQEGNPPTIPVAHAENDLADGAHGAAPGGHGESTGGHGNAKKDDGNGASKPKAPTKKPPRKNKAAAKAKPPADAGAHH